MNYLDAVTDFIFAENEPEPSDIIFIPGNSSPLPSEHAARLYREGLAPLLLPSGRYSVVTGNFPGPSRNHAFYPGPYQTEWAFMKSVLTKNGVPEEAILKEAMAQYTYQNALNSRDVLLKEQIDIKRAILCCKPYHARRCLMYYSMVFPDVTFFVSPAPGSSINRDNWQQSEKGLTLVLGELERCGKQFIYMLCQHESSGPSI